MLQNIKDKQQLKVNSPHTYYIMSCGLVQSVITTVADTHNLRVRL